MTTRQIGTYRDAHLELEHLMRQLPYILEKAVTSAVEIHAPFFHQSGPDLRHRLTGQTIEEWVAGRRKTNPNDFADYEPVSEEQVMHETIEDACLTPSPATLAKLYKAVGELRYRELLRQWGTDAARMLPGKRPGSVEQAAEGAAGEEKTRDSSNPWSPSWRGTEDEAQAERIRIIGTGTDIAKRMAYRHGMSPLGYPLVKK
jgi:hypothetical protein